MRTGFTPGAARWKIAGVAVGATAVVTTTTAAYACYPADTGAATTIKAASFVADPSAYAAMKAAWVAAEESALAHLGTLVSALQAKADAIGTPATLTPRQAFTIKREIGFLAFVDGNLSALPTSTSSALPATDVATASALAAKVSALEAQLKSVLANATVVGPVTPTTTTKTDFASVLATKLADPTRHHCDGDWSGSRTFGDRYAGHRDGDRQWDDWPSDHHDSGWHR